MAFERPCHDREVVDLAGDALIGYADAVSYFTETGGNYLDVINNWRLSHAYPLNTFQMTLRNRTRRVARRGIVAQRIKRIDSIESKLRRLGDTLKLKLSEIQDIGGCRAIVTSVHQIDQVVDLYRERYSSHVLDDQDDYIRKPKSDGYRGYHLIYRYFDPKHPEYENLKIEMQLRTALQHAWATAVETVDTFLREGLKSHRGSPDWRRFFALMGSAIALREGCRRVPRTPGGQAELIAELRHYVDELNVMAQLEAFRRTLGAIRHPSLRHMKWVILELDPRVEAPGLRFYVYRAGDLEHATDRLETLERHKAKGVDAVLVSVAGAASLRRAYPNYFLDTRIFLQAVRDAIRPSRTRHRGGKG